VFVAGWFVAGTVRWIAAVVVPLNAGNALFRGGAPASTQGGRHGREAAVGIPMDLFSLDGKVALVTGAGRGLPG